MDANHQTESSETREFLELVDRLLAGDTNAAEQVIRDYEPEIRRIARVRLRDPKLRRVVDSMDICQSVFGRFFVLANLGRFELKSPHDLIKLLTKMATNKVIDKHRTEHSQRNLVEQRAERVRNQESKSSRHSESPANEIEFREMLDRAKAEMTESEVAISNLRRQGLSWVEISQELGESPQALRKRLERACTRIVKQLAIE